MSLRVVLEGKPRSFARKAVRFDARAKLDIRSNVRNFSDVLYLPKIGGIAPHPSRVLGEERFLFLTSIHAYLIFFRTAQP